MKGKIGQKRLRIVHEEEVKQVERKDDGAYSQKESHSKLFVREDEATYALY